MAIENSDVAVAYDVDVAAYRYDSDVTIAYDSSMSLFLFFGH